jgi:tRNA threonylcarbamoyladenosine biosynthesis protein TsaB
MAFFLLIETATSCSSAAISEHDRVVASALSDTTERHTDELSVLIRELLKTAGISYKSLNAIAVSAGPGSYTGLRIGTALAKGLCYGLDIPLIAISTLEIMAFGYASGNPENNGLICPMIDARRMEVYTALFDHNGRRLKEDQPLIVSEELNHWLPGDEKISFIGNGVAKSQAVLSGLCGNPVFEPGIFPLAANMASLALSSYEQGKKEDLAWFEPYYLKPFQGKTPS